MMTQITNANIRHQAYIYINDIQRAPFVIIIIIIHLHVESIRNKYSPNTGLMMWGFY